MKCHGMFQIHDRERRKIIVVALYIAMLSRGLLDLLLKILMAWLVDIIHVFIMSVHDPCACGTNIWLCMCAVACLCERVSAYVCASVCACCYLERRMTDTYYSHVCGTVIILRASLLLGNASECPREMIPFHTDNRIWSKQKLSLQPIYFSLPVPPLILIAAAWNTNKRYISGLLAGDKRCWNRKSLGQSVPVHFQLPTSTVLFKALIMITFCRSVALHKK